MCVRALGPGVSTYSGFAKRKWPAARFDVSMNSANPQPVRIAVPDAEGVSGLLQVPAKARACYVLAHGAGAGMTHPFMAAIANGLSERGIATLRYQFPCMSQFRRVGSGSIATGSEACSFRWRKIVWRSDDFASAS